MNEGLCPIICFAVQILITAIRICIPEQFLFDSKLVDLFWLVRLLIFQLPPAPVVIVFDRSPDGRIERLVEAGRAPGYWNVVEADISASPVRRARSVQHCGPWRLCSTGQALVAVRWLG